MVRLADDVRIEPLVPGIWRHVSVKVIPGYGPFASNGLIVDAGAGSLVIDTAYTDAQTAQLLDWAASKVGPVRALIATHAHDDRMGGVGAARGRGIPVISHTRAADRAVEQGWPRPDETFADTLDLSRFGVQGQAYYPGPAHAPGNVVVWLPEPGVLFGGCMIRAQAHTRLGHLADADVPGWAAAAQKVLERFGGARSVVPGHGAPGGIELVRHTRELARRGAR